MSTRSAVSRHSSSWSGAARIARHEWRHAWRSRALLVLGIVLTALLAGAAVVGHDRDRAETEQRARYQALVAEQFANQPDRHPHRVSHYGYLLFRPRVPLGFFDNGVEPFAGTSLFLEAHRQNTTNFSRASQGSDSSRVGDLTLASVLQMLVPLFVFALAGVSLTREREAGTLSLLLCQGTSVSQIVWGKLCGTVLTASVVLAPGLLLAAGWLALRGEAGWTGDTAARLLGLAAVHLIFLVACAALAMTVSAWHRTSRGALVSLIGLWCLLWIVLPRALPVVSAALHPLPARATFDAEVEARVMELGDSHNPDDPVFARLRAETLRRYNVTRIEDLPFNYNGFVTSKGEEVTTDAYRQHLTTLLDVFRRQNRIVEWAGALSPYLAIRLASMTFAGSDVAHQIEFERQAEDYRFRLVQALNDLHTNEVSHAQDRYGTIVNGAPTRHRVDAAFFDRLPAFEFMAPDVGWAMRQQGAGLLAGGLGVLLILGGLSWSTARLRLE